MSNLEAHSLALDLRARAADKKPLPRSAAVLLPIAIHQNTYATWDSNFAPGSNEHAARPTTNAARNGPRPQLRPRPRNSLARSPRRQFRSDVARFATAAPTFNAPPCSCLA